MLSGGGRKFIDLPFPVIRIFRGNRCACAFVSRFVTVYEIAFLLISLLFFEKERRQFPRLMLHLLSDLFNAFDEEKIYANHPAIHITQKSKHSD
jgi:hypothetical protein